MTGQARASAGTDFSRNTGQLASPLPHCTVTTKVILISSISNGMDPTLKAVASASALNLPGAANTENGQLEEKYLE